MPRDRTSKPILTSRLPALLALALLAGGCAGTSVGGATPAGTSVAGAAPAAPGRAAVQPQPSPGSCHARGAGLFSLPDPRCTPGAADRAVTQANIEETICRTGYTRTVRPPESVTEREKRASLAAYGDSGPLHRYEYDHLIALELGGAPNDPRNLWPEPGSSPNPKDELERRLRDEICAGRISLHGAQQAIARNWVAAYHRYVR